MSIATIRDIEIGQNKDIALIAGPCAIENEEMAFEVAETLLKHTSKLNIPFVYKASFDKANRMSIHSKRGVGIEKGMAILEKIKNTYNIPIITDIHEPSHVNEIASVVDCVQIPAFLSRQTDLAIAAAQTGKCVNIKKGQFLAPSNMEHIAEKVSHEGNNNILLTERGTTFGYGDIILDPRSLIIMKKIGYPVVLDVTHTTQKPGAAGNSTGGNREYTSYFIKIGIALEIDAFYLEVHPDPNKAISDKQSQIPLDEIEEYLALIKK